MAHDEVDQCLQGLDVAGLAAVGEVLEVAEADEAGRHPRDDGRRLDGFAPHRQGRCDQAQGARGRYAQAVHGLAAKKLANGRSQHRPSICAARVGRGASALELDLLWADRRVDFAEQQGPAIAKLASPDAELMPAVDRGHRRHAGPDGIAAQDIDRAGHVVIGRCTWPQLMPVRGPSKVGRQLIVDRHPLWHRQRIAAPIGTQRNLPLRCRGTAQIGVAVEPMGGFGRPGGTGHDGVSGRLHVAQFRQAPLSLGRGRLMPATALP